MRTTSVNFFTRARDTDREHNDSQICKYSVDATGVRPDLLCWLEPQPRWGTVGHSQLIADPDPELVLGFGEPTRPEKLGDTSFL